MRACWECFRSFPFRPSLIKEMFSIFIALMFVWTECVLAAPNQAENVELFLQLGHGASIRTLAFSPNGQFLVSGSMDKTAKIWDIRTGRVLQTLVHDEIVNSVAFSPDGRWLATGSDDKTVKLWDVSSGREVHHLKHKGYVKAVAFHPNGKTLASGGSEAVIRFWDVTTGQQVGTLHQELIVENLGYGLDGRRMITKHPGGTIVWDIKKNSVVHEFAAQDIGEPFAISPNGRSIVKAGPDHLLKLIDIATGETLRILTGHTDRIRATTFSPDGLWLASGGIDKTIIWSIESGQPVRTMDEKWEDVLVFSPDSRRLVSVILGASTAIRFLNIETGELLRTLGEQQDISLAAFSPDGKWLATSTGFDSVRLQNLKADQSPFIIPAWQAPWREMSISCLCFSPNSRWLAAGTVEYDFAHEVRICWVRVWDVMTGREVHAHSGHTKGVNSISFSPNGELLASGSSDSTVIIWNLKTKTGRTLKARGNRLFEKTRIYEVYPDIVSEVLSVRFSRDGRLLAAANLRGAVEFWNVTTGEEVGSISFPDAALGGLKTVEFSDDGHWLATVMGSTIHVWDILSLSGKVKPTYSFNGSKPIAFTPNSRELVSQNILSRGIEVRDLSSSELTTTLKGHTAIGISDIKVSSNGRLLVSVASDGVLIWDYKKEKLLVSFGYINENDWIVFDPSGFFDGTRRAWQLVPFRFPSEPLKLYEPEQFFNQFYQPGLLADIISEGKSMREILKARGDARAALDISKYRNSKLPEATIISPEDGFKTGEREIQITIEAKDTGSGIRDLRVFRNQTLVHFEHGELTPDTKTKAYRLPLPVKLVAGPNEISAYAFNRDNLKSKDSTITVTGADSLKRKGTAYVLAVGINRYFNTDWRKLNFAVDDAKGITETLDQSFNKLNIYARIVPVTLLDEEATKTNIQTILGLLSGSITSLSSETPDNLKKKLKKIRQAEPEDDIIIYFSGHGMVDNDRYYFIPHEMVNLGRKIDQKKDDAKRMAHMKHGISDEDLNKGFEKIDAGRMMLIIDACHSGQVMESEEKRLGPMNSRGLAQLAYEKGIYILAASQGYEDAQELEKLGHGILTATLLDGLNNREADANRDFRITAEEWLDYATQHVGREVEGARAQYAKKKGGEQIDGGEVTVTGQSPRAYYRRERVGSDWVIVDSRSAYQI